MLCSKCWLQCECSTWIDCLPYIIPGLLRAVKEEEEEEEGEEEEEEEEEEED